MSFARCLVRGSINIDEFFHVDEIVRPGETKSSEKLTRRSGGKGANQAVALARAGSQVDLIGAVGADGRWVVDELHAAGVDVSKVRVVDEPTGRAIIQLAADGENSILLFKGANHAAIDDPSTALHEHTTHLLLQNEIPFSSTLAHLALAANAPRRIAAILNPSPLPHPAELRTFPWAQLAWLVVNLGESRALLRVLDVGGAPADDLTPGALLRRLSAHMPTTNLVCTLGAAGVVAFVPGSTPWEISLPAARLRGDAVDTTGAGDCFTGYLAAGLVKAGEDITRKKLTEILCWAIQAAGICVERYGALESIPSKEEVDERLRDSAIA